MEKMMIRVMIGLMKAETLLKLPVWVWMSMTTNKMLGGETRQTFSAANWQRKRNGQLNLVPVIDLVFGRGHCVEAWVNWKVGVHEKGINSKQYGTTGE